MVKRIYDLTKREYPSIPLDVACCPVCGGSIGLGSDGWIEGIDDVGRVRVFCIAQPDPKDPELKGLNDEQRKDLWDAWHYDNGKYYDLWLPLERKIERWLWSRFELHYWHSNISSYYEEHLILKAVGGKVPEQMRLPFYHSKNTVFKPLDR